MIETKKHLAETFLRMLEHMAFMFADPTEATEVNMPKEVCLCASMSYSGPMEGTLQIASSITFCKELAANMLGIEMDERESVRKAADALKETLNTICGQFLTTIAGEKPVFQLGTPTACELSPEEWQKMVEDGACFDVNGSPVVLREIGEGA